MSNYVTGFRRTNPVGPRGNAKDGPNSGVFIAADPATVERRGMKPSRATGSHWNLKFREGGDISDDP